MAFLTVALLSVIAHLAFGQGMGPMGFGNAGSSWGQAGATLGQAGGGFGQAGGAFGQAGAGFGQAGAGAGLGQTGFGFGQAGAGAGLGQAGAGAGLGQAGAGFGQAGAGAGLGQAGFGFGQAGAGAGLGQAGFGLGQPRLGFGRLGAGWGQIGGLGQNIINPISNTTITCTFTATGITGSLTLRRRQPSWGGWGWGQSRGGLTGSAVLRTSTVSGTYNLVITERSRVEAGCTSDGLGPVIGSNVWGQRFGQGLGQGWGQRWGHQWGQGLGQQWGQSWGTGTTTTPGVVTSVTLSTNQESVIDLASANLPFRELERYGGRGLALCSSLTTGTDGRQVCMEPILACCKLGFDNMDAVTPAAP